MAFLPFYIPRHKQLRILIIGAGYAGISALVTIFRYMPRALVTIIDPRPHHLKITHLHETFRYPLEDFRIPFSVLENRYGCRHVCAELEWRTDTFLQWQNDKSIFVDGEILKFDYALVASGFSAAPIPKSANVADLHDFMDIAGSSLWDTRLDHDNNRIEEGPISVIGGGATGIQFLFEIAHFLKRRKSQRTLRLIHGDTRTLSQFPTGFSTYAQDRMSEMNIDFYPGTLYREQQRDQILLEEMEGGRQYALPSAFSFLFVGKAPSPLIRTNAFGQVLFGQKPLQNIFAAGDCSNFQAFGSNTCTAQSAVRKGILAARNMLRHSGTLKLLEPYLHRDLGYVVSLGPEDAVGWLASEGNVVTGMPALVIKEVVEAQYDLLLEGINSYLL
ncbi:MAG TPA: FAD-dependent oxidoreductase [Nitrosospira sp.]|nr:FAD-dependent oxidoreductase [Nitrosospira sp.]